MPPFSVSRWFKDGERLKVGGEDLEVIHTPGEARDQICLLDRARRILFCGEHLAEWSGVDPSGRSQFAGLDQELSKTDGVLR